ncbi:MAG: hypothetical protein AAFN10_26495, partial [Bacteroidota bacterium]
MTRFLIFYLSCICLLSCQNDADTHPDQSLDDVLQLLVPTDSLAAKSEAQNALFGMLSEGNYLESLQDMLRNKESLMTKYPPDMYYQALGTSLSKVGEYQTVFEAWSLQMESVAKSLNQDSLAASLQTLKLFNAKAEILAAGQQQQVIMINEAHHLAAHRIFTKSLLAGLYQSGFRYLAAETLS